MEIVGARCNFLKASSDLQIALQSSGKRKQFAAGQVLFREDDDNVGVFLLAKGKVRMGVYSMPKLDRILCATSLMGLPSTFTARPYSLTAQALTAAEVVQVSQNAFLQLMRDRPDLCREATEMLGREATFIQAALTARRQQVNAKRVPTADLTSNS